MRAPNAAGLSTLFWGAASGVSAAGQVKYPQYAPLWDTLFWGSLGIMALSGIAWLLLWLRGDDDRKPDHDLRLQDFVRLRFGRSMAHQDSYEEGDSQKIYDLFRDIAQAARSNRINVWARPGIEPGRTDKPLAPVPLNFWDNGEIDALGFQGGGVGLAGTLSNGSLVIPKTEYSDIYFDKRQMARAFPKRWPKIRIKSPITIEKRT